MKAHSGFLLQIFLNTVQVCLNTQKIGTEKFEKISQEIKKLVNFFLFAKKVGSFMTLLLNLIKSYVKIEKIFKNLEH